MLPPLIHDGNISPPIRQTANPFDATASNDAVDLMTDFTAQILTALQK